MPMNRHKVVFTTFNLLILFFVLSINTSAFFQKTYENRQPHYLGENYSIEFLSIFAERKAPSFTLQDQFGKNISVKFPSDKVCVLVFGDREGAEQIEGWVRPLYGKFTDRIYIFGIAELSAVPWVAKPIVRGIIKSKSKNPIMLDWSGKISKSYGYQKGKANLFVVNREGVIVAEKRGAATSAALSDLYGEIDSVL